MLDTNAHINDARISFLKNGIGAFKWEDTEFGIFQHNWMSGELKKEQEKSRELSDFGIAAQIIKALHSKIDKNHSYTEQYIIDFIGKNFDVEKERIWQSLCEIRQEICFNTGTGEFTFIFNTCSPSSKERENKLESEGSRFW